MTDNDSIEMADMMSGMDQNVTVAEPDLTADQPLMPAEPGPGMTPTPIMIYGVILLSFANMLLDLLWSNRLNWYTLTYVVIIAAAASSIRTNAFLWVLGFVSLFQILIAIYQLRAEDPWMPFPWISLLTSVVYILYIGFRLSLESLSLEK